LSYFTARPFPQIIQYATSVSFGDSFLVVGGYGDTLLSTIFQYNPDEDSWTLLSSRMKQSKAGVFAMMVEREMFEIQSSMLISAL
jgi:N-acetylneuraminic acid mutarotase